MVDLRFNGAEIFLIVERSANVQQLELELEKKLIDLSVFLENQSRISVFFEGGDEQAPLIPLILEKMKDRSLHIRSIYFDKPSDPVILPSKKDRTQSSGAKTHPRDPDLPYPSHPKMEVFQGTVRSGQVISSPGDFLIIGNVNAGCEVIAGGSIIVFGEIHGSVRAGQVATEGALIVGFSLQPLQIQIGDVIHSSIHSTHPSLCFLKNGHLTLAPIALSNPMIDL